MKPVTFSAKQLQQHIERKAYAYGVSSPVCTLLGEYVIQLLKTQYGKQKESRVV